MRIKQPREFAQGLGIGAALMIALGAVSFFRPSLAAVRLRSPEPAKPAANTRKLSEKAATLPADYLDLCRAAGL